MKKYQLGSSEIKKVQDGLFYICEWSDSGKTFQDLCINVNGRQFYKTDSCYNDIKTGAALDCFSAYDEDENYLIAVINLDGSIEVH